MFSCACENIRFNTHIRTVFIIFFSKNFYKKNPFLIIELLNLINADLEKNYFLISPVPNFNTKNKDYAKNVFKITK